MRQQCIAETWQKDSQKLEVLQNSQPTTSDGVGGNFDDSWCSCWNSSLNCLTREEKAHLVVVVA